MIAKVLFLTAALSFVGCASAPPPADPTEQLLVKLEQCVAEVTPAMHEMAGAVPRCAADDMPSCEVVIKAGDRMKPLETSCGTMANAVDHMATLTVEQRRRVDSVLAKMALGMGELQAANVQRDAIKAAKAGGK